MDYVPTLQANMDQLPKPQLKIWEVSKITPSPSPATEFSLPLTCFDLIYLVISPPTERILYFSLPADEAQPQLDYSILLHNLKQSLSLTLSHFLPLAGNIVWPNHDSTEPIILYKPGDSVSLTIAQTDADFNHFSKNHVRKANESHFLVPKLQISDTVSPAMCLQITLFPNIGFSIGIITNHVVVDGKSSTMFLKSWASICTQLIHPTLPPELTPVFDRTAVKDLTGLQTLRVNLEMFVFSNPNSQGKRLRLVPKVSISDDVASGTFELTHADIENLRKKAAATITGSTSTQHLTSFVVTFAYVTTCIVKAQRLKPKSKIALVFIVDWRPRLGAVMGLNYFGNGGYGYMLFMEAREFEEENAMGIVSNKMGGAIAKIEETAKSNKVVELLNQFLIRWCKEMPISETIVVAGSPRFGVYDIDFGWGVCEKVEMTSITPGGTFSLAECRNGNGGGVEVGIALPQDAMNIFCSLFSEGLEHSK